MRSGFAHFFRTDIVLVSVVLLLTSIGLLALYSFSETVAGNIYIGAMFFVGTLDYRHFARMSTPLYFFTIAVLFFVLFFGSEIRGTVGWFSVAGFQVQPVEFAKIVLVIFLASFISKKRSELGEWTRLIASLFLVSLLVLLVLHLAGERDDAVV